MNLSALPKPKFILFSEKKDGFNNDIISAIEKNFPDAVKQTEKFAQGFKDDTLEKSAENVWNFLKFQIPYKKDSEQKQIIKLPARFIHDGLKGIGADCKSFSLTAAALLKNLGFKNVRCRYANYKSGKIPTHVYTVANDHNGNEIILDACWKSFNSQKQPNYYFDKNMNIYSLHGIDGIGKIRLGKALKKFGLSAPRNSFLLLVRENVFGFGTKFNDAISKDEGKSKKKWEQLGGNFNKLKSAATKGSKKKRILGTDETLNGIGFAPAAIAAAAVPIIVAMKGLLKDLGLGSKQADEALDKASAELKAAGEDPALKMFDPTDKNDPRSKDVDIEKDKGFSFTPKTILILGGAAALGIILLKRKK